MSCRRSFAAVRASASFHQPYDARLEARKIADHPEAHAVRVQLLDFLLERRDEKLHEELHFVRGGASSRC